MSILFSSAFLYSQSFELGSSTISINELSSILKSTSAKDRLDVISLAYKIDTEEFYSKICAHYFEEKDKYIQKIIVEYTAYKTNIEECRDVIKDAFENSNDAIRNTAFLSINETMDNELIKIGRENGKRERKRSIKMNFLQRLGKVDKSTEAVRIISDEVLNSNDDEIKSIAIKGLSLIGTDDAKKELERIFKKDDKKVKEGMKKKKRL